MKHKGVYPPSYIQKNGKNKPSGKQVQKLKYAQIKTPDLSSKLIAPIDKKDGWGFDITDTLGNIEKISIPKQTKCNKTEF